MVSGHRLDPCVIGHLLSGRTDSRSVGAMRVKVRGGESFPCTYQIDTQIEINRLRERKLE